ncbi:Trans-2,3-dihydro-3-hydroxyanthranilate isomerase [Shimia sp. SK013]|uniref:PhzF family phenazine biosynthesis protein n=1 Tax=Shimia sp. SK013 TaxID=1389006 RepID=UPI0006B44B86|nr:PhzF family phenazine biosynthesis protein [Shimia sp. SK013]KPA22398.1 Trans-2,3-dihydro-3-hydroxyanthranilate isomerase [Shimia sp. SK013]
MTAYSVYDVFTKQPFGGNQLAVIPNAIHLPEMDLQRIAAEFNFSETTFVYPPSDTNNTAHVRIFTPTMEVPFAGHPVIGTAVALASAGHGPQMTFELGVGPLSVHAEKGAASFTTSADLEILAQPDLAVVAKALGVAPTHIRTDRHPPIMVSLGLAFTFTEIDSREALAALETDVSAFRQGNAAYPSGLDFAQFVYVRDGNHIDARMFAPLDNIPEDPATGSACATLAALLAHKEGTDLTFDILQGEDMGRPSHIQATTNGPAVTISGHAVCTMQGTLVY